MENNEEKIFPNFDPTKDLTLAGKNRRMKRGLGAKPILESEIRDAQKKARSAMEAARLLGISYNTYKKYARQYNIFEDLKNPDGKGIRKGYNIKRGKFSLDDILAGKYPDYPIWKLKQRLLLNVTIVDSKKKESPMVKYHWYWILTMVIDVITNTII